MPVESGYSVIVPDGLIAPTPRAALPSSMNQTVPFGRRRHVDRDRAGVQPIDAGGDHR